MRHSAAQDRSTATVVIGVAVVLAVAVGAVVVWAAMRGEGPERAGTMVPAPAVTIAPSARSVGVLPAVESLAVLRDWDRARAAAWEAGDIATLRALYTRGSAAGTRDVAMLRQWRGRGLRVRGMSMQVLAVELRARAARRLVLVVTDRLVGAEAVRGHPTATPGGLSLPTDRPTTRQLTFVRTEAGWVLDSATPVRS